MEPDGIEKDIADAMWIIQNPQFEEKPATILEFLGPGYLDIDKGVRPGIKKALSDVFGLEVQTNAIAVYERAMITGGIGIGKQLDPTEKVITPIGLRQIQDLRIGDQVLGRNGQSCTVTHTARWENIARYRLTFKDGTSINAGADHLWTVRERGFTRVNGKMKRVFREKTYTTEYLSQQNLMTGEMYTYSLPLVEPVEYGRPVEQEIDPYILGLLLANGSFTHGTPSIAAHDDDLAWVQLQVSATTPGLRAVNSDRRISISGVSGVENWVQTALKRLGLLNVTSLYKFIPDDYKFGSATQRLELLRGLMDGDGSAYGNNNTTFSTSSMQLAYEVADVVRSLGGYCTVTDFTRDRQGSESTEYQVHVNMGSVCPFKNPRKVKRWRPRSNQKPNRAIVSIERIEDGPGVCISVDAPDHLYVVRDFIVTHNSTFASIVLPYMVHWVLCLRNPQEFFGLLPGSRIAFMMMSTSEKQAKEVIFGDVFARIRYSKWFKENYPYDPTYKIQIKFPQKDIWILPGDSQETTFEGYNILGGILDEADSHKTTKEKDYAEVGYSTIEGRVTSRFGHKGLVVIIGQMKKATGFAARKYAEFLVDPKAYTMRMTIWESRGWDFVEDGKKVFLNEDGTRNSFYYDYKRRQFIPKAVGDLLPSSNTILEIPEYYRRNFQSGPEKALKDLAGIPPKVSDPFISLVDKIESCRERWIERFFGDEEERSPDLSVYSPVDTSSHNPKFAPWFTNVQNQDPRRRAIHVDIAYSAEGDSLGMAMGHIAGMKEDVEGELKPIIVYDFLLRIHAAAGQEIMLSDVRKIIYHLRDTLKFRISKITYDGFESTDSVQQLRKKRFVAEKASVDKSTLPYEDLRDAIYEERLEFPPYVTELSRGDDDRVEIALKELSELQDTGKKVDHPPKGSKDVTDAMAGVAHELIGDRKYRRGVASLSIARQQATGTDALAADAPSYMQSLPNMPLMPSPERLSDLGIVIPMHLRPRR